MANTSSKTYFDTLADDSSISIALFLFRNHPDRNWYETLSLVLSEKWPVFRSALSWFKRVSLTNLENVEFDNNQRILLTYRNIDLCESFLSIAGSTVEYLVLTTPLCEGSSRATQVLYRVGDHCTGLKALEIYWEFGQDALHDTALLDDVVKIGDSVERLSISRLLLEDAAEIFSNALSASPPRFEDIATTLGLAFPSLKWLEMASCLADMNLTILREVGPRLKGVSVDLSGIGLSESLSIVECLEFDCTSLTAVFLGTCDYYHPLIYEIDNRLADVLISIGERLQNADVTFVPTFRIAQVCAACPNSKMVLLETFQGPSIDDFLMVQRTSMLGSRLVSLTAKISPSMEPHSIANVFSNCDSLETLEILTPRVTHIALDIFSRPHRNMTTLRLCYIGTITNESLLRIAQTTGQLRNLEIDALEFENVSFINPIVCANPHLREISILRQNLRPGCGPYKFAADVVSCMGNAVELEELNVKPMATYWGARRDGPFAMIYSDLIQRGVRCLTGEPRQLLQLHGRLWDKY